MNGNKRNLVRATVLAAIVGVVAGTLMTSVSFADDPEPPATTRPAWIRADGTIDESQIPSEGIPVVDELGEIACHIGLNTYLEAGGVPGVDIVTDSNTPVDEFETEASSSHTELDDTLRQVQLVDLPAMTLC